MKNIIAWAVVDKEDDIIDFIEHDPTICSSKYSRCPDGIDKEYKIYPTRQGARDQKTPFEKVLKVIIQEFKK